MNTRVKFGSYFHCKLTLFSYSTVIRNLKKILINQVRITFNFTNIFQKIDENYYKKYDIMSPDHESNDNI